MQTEWMMAKENWKTAWQWLVVGLLALATYLTPNLAAGPIAAVTGNACQQTADAALTSCKTAAQSDYKLALGKCINITDPTGRQTCEKRAGTKLKDALDTCEGGFEVRQSACQKFGPAPYRSAD